MIKKVLITGSNSYVSSKLMEYLENYFKNYEVTKVSVRGNSWKEINFEQYDVIIHNAALVHKKEKKKMKNLYYKVNKDLTLEIAMRAKEANVKQFIFMSTMSVYGQEGTIGKKKVINKMTTTNPQNYYASSKLEAEIELNKLNETNFKVSILRPPMIYGHNSPGNYNVLEKFAKITLIFPYIENERSMISIKNLCIFIEKIIYNNLSGTYLPQDNEYVNTSMLVKNIAEKNNNKVLLSKKLGKFVLLFFKKSKIIKKIFGNLVYEHE